MVTTQFFRDNLVALLETAMLLEQPHKILTFAIECCRLHHNGANWHYTLNMLNDWVCDGMDKESAAWEIIERTATQATRVMGSYREAGLLVHTVFACTNPLDHLIYHVRAIAACLLGQPDILKAAMEVFYDIYILDIYQSLQISGIMSNGMGMSDILMTDGSSVIIDKRWLTSTVIDLVDVIRNSKDYSRVPILGDALMDAGCDHQRIIEHCHGHGRHVPYCWVVDRLFGASSLAKTTTCTKSHA